MTAAGDGMVARATFAVAALLLGTPTVVVGGWLASLALFFGLAGLASGDDHSLLLMVWGLAGLVGLVAALVLSVAYVHGGRASLRRRSWPWWPALLAGMAAAVSLLPVIVQERDGEWLAISAAGPLLLPVALALLVLRWSARDISPAPGPRSPVPS